MSTGILNTIGVLVIIILITKILAVIGTIFVKLYEKAKEYEQKEENNKIKELQPKATNYKETRMGFIKGEL